jgi:hypothetical protein
MTHKQVRPPWFSVDDVGRLVAGGDNKDLMDYIFGRELTQEEYISLWDEAIVEIISQHWWFQTIVERRLMEDVLYSDDRPELVLWLNHLKWHNGDTVFLEPIRRQTDTEVDMLSWEAYLASFDGDNASSSAA